MTPRFARWKILPLLGCALFLFCLWGYWELAEDYPEGAFRSFDEGVLRGFRTAANPAVPRGPAFLQNVMRDISALGSAVVLTLGVSAVIAYLVLQGRRNAAKAVTLACIGGVALDLLLKSIAERPRPEVVPHLVSAATTSFPSGHTLLSAIIYLSVGTMVAQRSRSRGLAVFALGFAALLTVLVGISRVYLGVHFPTDVLASWAAGTAWTLVCAVLQRSMYRRDFENTDTPQP